MITQRTFNRPNQPPANPPAPPAQQPWSALQHAATDLGTTPDGLVQSARVKPGVADAEVRAQLDNLAIVATTEIVIVERPGPVDVTVTAMGDAFFQEKDGAQEQRGASLQIVGRVDRTGNQP